MAKLNPDVFLLAAELLHEECDSNMQLGCCGCISSALLKLDRDTWNYGGYQTAYHMFFVSFFEWVNNPSYYENWGSKADNYHEREARITALLICWIEAKRCKR